MDGPAPRRRAPLTIAHRGLPKEHGENRASSLLAAIDAGADGIEFDVRLTADGVPIILHDPDLERTHGIERSVAEMRASEVPGDVPRLAPFLEEVAARTWDGILDIELKVPIAPDVVASLVPSTIDPSRVIVTSFDPAVITDHATNGSFRTGILVRRHPFSNNIIVKARPTHLQAVFTYVRTRRDTDLRRNVRTLLGHLIATTRADAVLVQDPGFVALDESRRVTHEHGVELWLWTLNTRRQWRRAKRYGADAVITDDAPGAIRNLA